MMKMKTAFSPMAYAVMVCLVLMTAVKANAQRHPTDYLLRDGRVFYEGNVVKHADIASFVELGYGYAKDYYNVYHRGKVLEYVDPRSFRLKQTDTPDYRDEVPYHYHHDGGGYKVTSRMVLFNGKKISDVSVKTFKVLDGGYAADAFNVYFLGIKVSGASPNTFHYLGDGYAKDAFNVYYQGREVNDAGSQTFKVTGNGYAEDAFSTFYRGRKIDD